MQTAAASWGKGRGACVAVLVVLVRDEKGQEEWRESVGGRGWRQTGREIKERERERERSV